MSQEPALLDADTGEENVETPELEEVAETGDAPSAETEVEDVEPTGDDAEEEAEADEEAEPSLDELLSRDDIDDEEFDRLQEKFPALKKKLEWRQAQARDAATQKAQSEAAKRARQENAKKYANGQLAQEWSQFISTLVENGDDPDPRQIQQKLGETSQSLNEYHFQNNMAALAQAVDRAVPEGAQMPQKAQERMSTATNQLEAGQISVADWLQVRMETYAEQYVSAKEPELRKKWQKEMTEKRKDQKETERLKNSDAKRKSGTSPTTTQGTPGGDDPDTVITGAASKEAKLNAYAAKYGERLEDIFPRLK